MRESADMKTARLIARVCVPYLYLLGKLLRCRRTLFSLTPSSLCPILRAVILKRSSKSGHMLDAHSNMRPWSLKRDHLLSEETLRNWGKSNGDSFQRHACLINAK